MTTPAGWYDDGSGRQRWWDGQQWTEHFAPEAPAAPAAEEASEPASETASEIPSASETPSAAETPSQTPAEVETAAVIDSVQAYEAPAGQDSPAASEPDGGTADETVAPDAAQDWTAPASAGQADAQTSEPYAAQGDTGAYQGDTAAYPGATPSYAAAPPAYPGAAPSYPGAAPSYPAAPGAHPAASGGYPPAGTGYPGAGYPGAAPAAGPTKISILGLVGLGLAVLGTIFACIPGVFFIGWILLPVGFVLSLISLFLKGKKWPGITGLGVSVLGTILGVVMAFVFVTLAASSIGQAIQDEVDDLPTAEPTTAPEDTDEGDAPSGEVQEGVIGEPVTVEQYSGTSEVTVNSASWGTSNGTDFAPSNGGYLTLDLSWAGLDGTSYVNPLYLSVETAEGATGDYDYFADTTLESGEVGAGESLAGTVSFDVAQSGSYVVIITDELLQEVARITVEASAR